MRNEIINTINNLFDENIDLKVRNEYLEGKLDKENVCCEKVESNVELTELDKKVLKYGKAILLDKVIVPANISVNKLDNEGYSCTKFEDWSKDSIYTYNMPDNFSKEELINLLNDELHQEYNEKKARKISEYEKSHEVEE